MVRINVVSFILNVHPSPVSSSSFFLSHFSMFSSNAYRCQIKTLNLLPPNGTMLGVVLKHVFLYGSEVFLC